MTERGNSRAVTVDPSLLTRRDATSSLAKRDQVPGSLLPDPLRDGEAVLPASRSCGFYRLARGRHMGWFDPQQGTVCS